MKEFVGSRHAGFAHDRSKTVGASEIGQCARKIAYEKQLGPEEYDEEYQPDLGFAERGNVMEDGYLAPLARYIISKAGGELLYSGQEDQISVVAEEVRASATPDGLAVNMPEDALASFNIPKCTSELLVELKSIDPRFDTYKLPKPEHQAQVNFATGLMRAATDYQPEAGLLIYADASNYSKVHPFPVRYSKMLFKSQLNRVDIIMDRDPDTISPEGKLQGGKQCYTCPFAKRCLGYLPWVPKTERTLTKAQQSQIKVKLEAVADAKDRLEEAKRLLKEAEHAAKEKLNDVGTNFATVGSIKGSWTTRAGAEKYDDKKIRELAKQSGIDIERFKTTNKPSEKLDVKRLN